MKTLIFAALLLIISGCTTTPIQSKRDRIIDCVKDLHNNDISSEEAFEICKTVYKL